MTHNKAHHLQSHRVRTARLAMLAGTVLVTALVLAACGSSSNTSSGSGNASSTSASAAAGGGGQSSATRTKFVACLKAHGVTLPNRPAGARRHPNGSGEGGGPPAGGAPPGGGGSGFFFGGGNGAQGGAAGRLNNPKFQAALKACGGAQFQRRRFTPNKAAVTKFVACVKQHGYDLPTPNFSGKGPIFPAKIEQDKKFQAAARACASDLRPQGGPGAPGAAGGGSASGSGSSSD
ncbi:MAG TPA: hypothetical protein VGG07_08605 [Solirubrobacteraceae bacterium]|jgi:hypothetical protein